MRELQIIYQHKGGLKEIKYTAKENTEHASGLIKYVLEQQNKYGASCPYSFQYACNESLPPVMPKIAEGWQKEKPNYPCKFVTRTYKNGHKIFGLYEMEIEEERLILHDNLIDEWIGLEELNADEYLLIEKQ